MSQQMIYFDNGVNPRAYDAVKLRAAAYLYNRAAASGRQATLATKDVAYLFGSVQDFEKAQRAPKWIYPAAGWQCDDSIGSTWGYTTGMTIRSAESVIHELVELVSQGGNLLLNISPMGDGSIPENQKAVLLAIGDWLRMNGEAVYDVRPWIRMGEGPAIPAEAPGDWKGGSTAVETPNVRRRQMGPPGEADFRFTTARGSLYVFGYKRPVQQARIASLAAGNATIARVTLLEDNRPLTFAQTADALMVTVPARDVPGPDAGYVLKVEGTFPLGGF